ncbi:uncharacterized protein [Parasteatoda tepidariorum]|uniref:uncharacterized protein n=1 Tax=Parasteatoda tepidariorum TaxID=114398 RepID=UPI00077FD9D1|nr:zinc finger protein 37 [Parasteatoda tepidariorum]XP_015925475.1 zinc finger protein 37 [Parasteatoda tepidariorum]XP_042896450.1 zinc finger protein 37 [Parasteatoda tepidariorum]XP_042896451.1 zinc finger protein 37 [Parasteatoda tepidariorum]XP_042896452.1 zinc finger protein 37 [Parasteatoda tepidariorum]
MKEGSEGDIGCDDVPTSRDADSTVSNGKVNGSMSMVSSQPRRILSDRPPSMGVTALATYEAEKNNASLTSTSIKTEHGNLPMNGTTLANALLGNFLDGSRGSSGSPGNNGESIVGGIHSTSSNLTGKGIKTEGGQNRDKQFMCKICDRAFGYKHVLQNHERTHTGEKPFECKECSKRFTRDHHLKTHMRLHTGEKPYHCSHCDRQFVQVANLRRHLRVHTGERPYACTLCSSRFSDSNQLKAHLLIHEGIKPFHCKKCSGRFRRRHHLVHHKCPRDEANIGRPRRGRRPRAYDQVPTPLPNSLPILSPVLKERLSTPLSDLTPHPPVSLTSVIKRSNSPTSPPIQPPAAHMQAAHMMHLTLGHISNFPLRPNSNGRYYEEVQTGPIDMTVQSSVTSNSVSVIVPRIPQQNNNNYHSSNIHSSLDVVLDLSNSKSDSEAEPIEEEVDEEDDCMDEGLDSESEEDDHSHLRLVSWKDDFHHHPKDLRRRNGDRYDSEGESSNLALQLKLKIN